MDDIRMLYFLFVLRISNKFVNSYYVKSLAPIVVIILPVNSSPPFIALLLDNKYLKSLSLILVGEHNRILWSVLAELVSTTTGIEIGFKLLSYI